MWVEMGKAGWGGRRRGEPIGNWAIYEGDTKREGGARVHVFSMGALDP